MGVALRAQAETRKRRSADYRETRKTSGEAKGEISTCAQQWVVLKIGLTMVLTIGQKKSPNDK